MILDKSVCYFVQHAIAYVTIINGYQNGLRILLFNDFQLVLKRVPPAFIMKFILASSADPCQPDFIKIRRGPPRVIKLLSKIQEDARFVVFKQTLLPYKVQVVLIEQHECH